MRIEVVKNKGIGFSFNPVEIMEIPKVVAFRLLENMVRKAFEEGETLIQQLENVETYVMGLMGDTDDPIKYVEEMAKKYGDGKVIEISIAEWKNCDYSKFEELLRLYLIVIFLKAININIDLKDKEKQTLEDAANAVMGFVELVFQSISEMLGAI